MPVQEGILYVPFGAHFPWDSDGIQMGRIEILTQEESWDVEDWCYMSRLSKSAQVRSEAALISGIMGNHEPED